MSVKNIDGFLDKLNVKDVNGLRLLNKDEKLLLKSKKYPDSGKIVLNLSDSFLLYEIANLLENVGFVEVERLLTGESNLSLEFRRKNLEGGDVDEKNVEIRRNILSDAQLREGIMYGNSQMKPSQDKFMQEVELLRVKDTVTVGAFSCIRCNSDKVETVQKQIRASDESASLFNKCLVCSKSWRIG